MAEHKVGLRAKAARGVVATLTLFFAGIACGGAPKADPCGEHFDALARMYSDSALAGGNVSDTRVEIWPSLGIDMPTHPSVVVGNKVLSYAEAVAFIDENCRGEGYRVESVGGYDYSRGVVVKRKPAQNFSLPEQSLNWVNSMLVAAAAVLGIGALGLGGKKLVGA